VIDQLETVRSFFPRGSVVDILSELRAGMPPLPLTNVKFGHIHHDPKLEVAFESRQQQTQEGGVYRSLGTVDAAGTWAVLAPDTAVVSEYVSSWTTKYPPTYVWNAKRGPHVRFSKRFTQSAVLIISGYIHYVSCRSTVRE
jgi:hypothetical protein